MDGKLSRNQLKGALGDALHAVMCGTGHNKSQLLRNLRLLCAQFGVELQEVLQLYRYRSGRTIALQFEKMNYSGCTKYIFQFLWIKLGAICSIQSAT